MTFICLCQKGISLDLTIAPSSPIIWNLSSVQWASAIACIAGQTSASLEMKKLLNDHLLEILQALSELKKIHGERRDWTFTFINAVDCPLLNMV